MLEATFLGYRKGAFTGASGDKKGVFELACSGTLFLDEIGDLPLESQGVLLRILEEKRLLPLGGTSEVEVNVRLITATNKNLWKMAKEGTFREDLLFRLQGIYGYDRSSQGDDGGCCGNSGCFVEREKGRPFA